MIGAAALSIDLARALAHAPIETGRALAMAAGLGFGWLAADFVSGFVHWFADRVASERIPWIGPNFIRPFREHHDDPLSITRHGFLETNGNTCIVAAPVLLLFSLWVDPRTGGTASAFAGSFALFLALAVCATNQIHKWAHTREPPRAVRVMQRAHLLLGADHHARHHRAPYATHFCITTGWLNAALDKARVFPALERIATGATAPDGQWTRTRSTERDRRREASLRRARS